jgi:sarcosine oxidase subunit delta
MRLPCPFCGVRDEGEFAFEGPVMDWPALDAPEGAWVEAVFLREQPKGEAEELWRHAHGCGSWLAITRNNVTHEVLDVRLARPGEARALPKKDRRA